MNFISAIKHKNKITQQICKMAIDSVNLYEQNYLNKQIWEK